MTPTELFTKQYMEFLQQEAKGFTEENKQDMIDSASVIIAIYLGSPKSYGHNFRFTKSADLIFAELRNKLYENFAKYSNNGIRLSQLKNQRIFKRIISAPEIRGFVNRKIQEFTLKQRIAKYTQMFRMELEARVAIAISEGEAQSALVKAMSAFIDDPYAYITPKFRNVWAANRLARKYNPGTGKYKSAYANFKRLAYSEIFEVYRRADHKIWSSQKEVVGQLIYLNPAHPRYDSCDELVGVYPAMFLFTGFHAACICLNIPIVKGRTITKIPDSAKQYMSQDKTMKWWGKLPFVQENLKYWK